MTATPPALLVIDMQVDFVDPASPAHVPGAAALVSRINQAARATRAQGGPVFWVVRGYAPDASDVERSRRAAWLRAPFAVIGSNGAELARGIKAEPSDTVLRKPSWSAFHETGLAEVLSKAGIETIRLGGVDLARCVRATVMDASALGFDVEVLRDAVSTRSSVTYEANLADLADLGIAAPLVEETLPVVGVENSR